MNAHTPSVAECIDYSRNFANSKPDIGSTEREHILGLCSALERQHAAVADLIRVATTIPDVFAALAENLLKGGNKDLAFAAAVLAGTLRGALDAVQGSTPAAPMTHAEEGAEASRRG